jgi:hypothetical protein
VLGPHLASCGMGNGDTYWDGVRRRIVFAVLVGLGAAALLYWLDDDVSATVLVGLVTALSVALVPSPREPAEPR